VDIPSIPTDNLYKFLAIGGVVAAIGGAYLSYLSSAEEVHRRTQLSLEQIEAQWKNGLAAAAKQISEGEERIAQLKFDRDTEILKKGFKDYQQNHQLSEEEKQFLSRELDQQSKDADEVETFLTKSLDVLQQQAIASNIEAKSKFDELELNWFYFYIRAAVWVGYSFQIVGSTACIWGFWSWYWRVQRYQDYLLIKEAAAVAPSKESFPV
jgi:hypothetical protein